jgi:hypothetical protein
LQANEAYFSTAAISRSSPSKKIATPRPIKKPAHAPPLAHVPEGLKKPRDLKMSKPDAPQRFQPASVTQATHATSSNAVLSEAADARTASLEELEDGEFTPEPTNRASASTTNGVPSGIPPNQPKKKLDRPKGKPSLFIPKRPAKVRNENHTLAAITHNVSAAASFR